MLLEFEGFSPFVCNRRLLACGVALFLLLLEFGGFSPFVCNRRLLACGVALLLLFLEFRGFSPFVCDRRLLSCGVALLLLLLEFRGFSPFVCGRRLLACGVTLLLSSFGRCDVTFLGSSVLCFQRHLAFGVLPLWWVVFPVCFLRLRNSGTSLVGKDLFW